MYSNHIFWFIRIINILIRCLHVYYSLFEYIIVYKMIDCMYARKYDFVMMHAGNYWFADVCYLNPRTDVRGE